MFHHLCVFVINKLSYVTRKRKTFLSFNKSLLSILTPPTCIVICEFVRVPTVPRVFFRVSPECPNQKHLDKNRTLRIWVWGTCPESAAIRHPRTAVRGLRWSVHATQPIVKMIKDKHTKHVYQNHVSLLWLFMCGGRGVLEESQETGIAGDSRCSPSFPMLLGLGYGCRVRVCI